MSNIVLVSTQPTDLHNIYDRGRKLGDNSRSMSGLFEKKVNIIRDKPEIEGLGNSKLGQDEVTSNEVADKVFEADLNYLLGDVGEQPGEEVYYSPEYEIDVLRPMELNNDRRKKTKKSKAQLKVTYDEITRDLEEVTLGEDLPDKKKNARKARKPKNNKPESNGHFNDALHVGSLPDKLFKDVEILEQLPKSKKLKQKKTSIETNKPKLKRSEATQKKSKKAKGAVGRDSEEASVKGTKLQKDDVNGALKQKKRTRSKKFSKSKKDAALLFESPSDDDELFRLMDEADSDFLEFIDELEVALDSDSSSRHFVGKPKGEQKQKKRNNKKENTGGVTESDDEKDMKKKKKKLKKKNDRRKDKKLSTEAQKLDILLEMASPHQAESHANLKSSQKVILSGIQNEKEEIVEKAINDYGSDRDGKEKDKRIIAENNNSNASTSSSNSNSPFEILLRPVKKLKNKSFPDSLPPLDPIKTIIGLTQKLILKLDLSDVKIKTILSSSSLSKLANNALSFVTRTSDSFFRNFNFQKGFFKLCIEVALIESVGFKNVAKLQPDLIKTLEQIPELTLDTTHTKHTPSSKQIHKNVFDYSVLAYLGHILIWASHCQNLNNTPSFFSTFDLNYTSKVIENHIGGHHLWDRLRRDKENINSKRWKHLIKFRQTFLYEEDKFVLILRFMLHEKYSACY